MKYRFDTLLNIHRTKRRRSAICAWTREGNHHSYGIKTLEDSH